MTVCRRLFSDPQGGVHRRCQAVLATTSFSNLVNASRGAGNPEPSDRNYTLDSEEPQVIIQLSTSD